MQFIFVFLFCFFLETVMKHWECLACIAGPWEREVCVCVCVCVFCGSRDCSPGTHPGCQRLVSRAVHRCWRSEHHEERWADEPGALDPTPEVISMMPPPPSYKIDMNSRVDSSWTLATLESLHFPEKPWGERNPTSQLPSFDLRFLLLSQPARMCHLCCCVSSALHRASLASLLFLPYRKPLIDVERLLFALLAKDLTLEAADDLSRARKLLHSEMSRVFCSWPLPWSLLCSWHIQLLSEINMLKRKDNKYTWVKMVRSCDWNQWIESSDIPSYLLIYGCMVNLLCHLLKAHLRIYLWISQRGWRKPDHGHPCQETVIFVPIKKKKKKKKRQNKFMRRKKLDFYQYELKVQGFFICHIINYTGYNQKWNVNKPGPFSWTVQKYI